MHPSCIKWLVARFALSEIPGLVQTMVCTHGVSHSILVFFYGANLACPDVSLQALGNQNNPPILVFAEDPGVEFRRATLVLDRF